MSTFVPLIRKPGPESRKAKSTPPAQPLPVAVAPAVPASVPETLRDGGRPLEPVLRAQMEAQIGAPLDDARIHTGSPAASSARALHAAAFTAGTHVVFGEGQFAPETSAGRSLLAHELAHVAQQSGARGAAGRLSLEARADAVAARFGGLVPPATTGVAPHFPTWLQLRPAACTSVAIDLGGSITFMGDEGPVSASLSLVGDLAPGAYHVTYNAGRNDLVIVPAPAHRPILRWSLPAGRTAEERTRLVGYLGSLAKRTVDLTVANGASAAAPQESEGNDTAADSAGAQQVGSPGNEITVISLSESEYMNLTGLPPAALPEGSFPPGAVFRGADGKPAPDYLVGGSPFSFGLSKLDSPFASGGISSPFSQSGTLSPFPSAAAGSFGFGSLFTPVPNYYYRVLSAQDSQTAALLGTRDLFPAAHSGPFEPASSAEMTFRQLRPGGNKTIVGTDRISTAADLKAFKTILAERGTGELVRVDVNLARRLGAQFLENGDITAHLDQIERTIQSDLEAARAAGRGKTAIARIEGRMRALQAAREYANGFKEGHGVESIPGRAVSGVEGSTLAEAVASEQAFARGLQLFRYGGRVMLVVGVGLSVYRVATAPPEERPRVAAEETTGLAFSFAGAAIGAKLFGSVGAAAGIETGPGAVATAALGALIGGAIGFFAGEEAADEAFQRGRDVVDLLRDTPRLIETTTLMFGTPEQKRKLEELREIETGEPSPFDF